MILKKDKLVSSYSQIDMHEQCPRKWYLRYIEKVRSNEKSKHLEYGLAVHETLEEFFLSIKKGNKMSLENLIKRYEEVFEKHDIPFDNSAEELESRFAGLIMIERLYEPLTSLEHLMVNSEILGVEMPLNLEIDMGNNFNHKTFDEFGDIVETPRNTVTIIGFIDLVLKTDEGIIVIDHKSGGKLYDKSKLKHNLQFPIYAMAIKEVYGELPVKCYYNFTRLHNFQEVSITEEIIEESRKRIVKTFKKMNNKTQTAKATPLCFWCDAGFHNLNKCERSSKFKPKKK